MSGMLAVMERELRSAVRSPVAFAVLGVFLALHGGFFVQLMQEYSTRSLQALAQGVAEDRLNLGDLMVSPLIIGDAFLLLFLLPALSMRSLADEWRQGTSDLLLSYPLRESDIVLGKYLASMVILAVLLLLGAAYPAGAAAVGRIEFPVLASGILGLFLFGGMVLALGLLFSALTENQVIAFVTTLLALLGLMLLGSWGDSVQPPWSQVLRHLSPMDHLNTTSFGLLQLSDAVFFASVAGLFLYLCVGVLEAKRWRHGGRR